MPPLRLMCRSPQARVAIVALTAVALACSFLLPGPPPAIAESPAPITDSGISITAEPMLGGRFKPGSWAAFRVLLENNGPTVDGELRLTSSTGGSSTFGRVVQLPTGARQQHVLYGQMGPLAGRFTISLVRGDTTLASVRAQVEASSADTPDVFLVAERAQSLVGPLDAAIDSVGSKPAILTISPEQLPPRAEAWSSADLIVWQDVESNRLDAERMDALLTWLAAGGNLVIAAGSTGVTTLGAFPDDLLPYQLQEVVDVPTTDLQEILGALPLTATSVTAFTGTLERGKELIRSGESVVAARADYGRGSVTLVGLDPSTSWLADSPAGIALWSRVLPSKLGSSEIGGASGDNFIVNALNNLPAVQLPDFSHLALLIAAYIFTIGPINYLILRRRDRRELAWLTMPVTIVAFAIGAYVFGVQLRGSNVVVNELAIVNGAAGTDRGLANIYVGVYSPSRSTFDVTVGGDALMSSPTVVADFMGDGQASQPVDVLLGDPATLRGYGVGFGVLRAFRAESALATPRVEADLRLVGDRLEGTVTNASDAALEQVSVVFGSSFQIVGDLGPGQSQVISFATTSGGSLADRLFPATTGTDASTTRSLAARRAIIRHLTGGWDEFSGRFGPGGATTSRLAAGPAILAWQSGATLDISVGAAAEHVGERLFVLHARAAITGPVTFAGNTLQHTTLELDSPEAFEEGGVYFLSRGTITAEYRATGFDGAFRASALVIRLGEGAVTPGITGVDLAPLPAEAQPDSDQPLAANPRPDAPGDTPRIQLYDHAAGTWVEFEPVALAATYEVAGPEQFVDESGAFRIRFVVRSQSDFVEFGFGARLSGTVE
ncbi:MAG: hypothetical protein ABI797_00160 [Chloroflexota bacterium]